MTARWLLAAAAAVATSSAAAALPMPSFHRVTAGNFTLGWSATPLPPALTLGMPNRLFGNADEFPYVAASVDALDVAITEVTNVQYEAYDPAHRAMRGAFNFSVGDDEAVVFVTFADAVGYTGWLSAQLNATARLPTEAEAEWYIRAGTTTYYNTGNIYPYGRNQGDSWWPAAGRNNYSVVVNLTVATAGPSNSFGLYDTHGNVEELTSTWYDSYAPSISPYPLPSTFKVTRGGSHSTDPYHLRSASRAGLHPSDCSWYVGFRPVMEVVPGNRHAAWAESVMAPVVVADGAAVAADGEAVLLASAAPGHYPRQRGSRGATGIADGAGVAAAGAPRGLAALGIAPWLRWHDVHRIGETAAEAGAKAAAAPAHPSPAAPSSDLLTPEGVSAYLASVPPLWLPPLKYVHVDTAFDLPYTTHNHDPALTVCPNGDVLAVWFSTITEPGRESGLAYARLPANGTAWPRASYFWHTPLRMENAPLLVLDADVTGTLFCFWGVSAAATWGSNALMMRTSQDCGETWGPAALVLPLHQNSHQPVNWGGRLADGRLFIPTDNNTLGTGGTSLHFSFDNGSTWTDGPVPSGQYIAGIHGVLTQLRNGTLLAHGRGDDIDGTMARSIFNDYGATWAYSASPWPGIGGGERASQMRLSEGAIMFCSYSNGAVTFTVPTACGQQRAVTGLYCAASLDEGDSWPYRKLVNEGAAGVMREQLDGVQFIANTTSNEGNGYSVARQGGDGTIHLITSRNHYRFNLPWLMTPGPC